MKTKEKAGVRGRLEIKITNVSSGETEIIKLNNLVVDTGLDALVNLLRGAGTGVNEIIDIGFGTDNTAAAAGDTTLTGLFSKTIDGSANIGTGVIEIYGSLATGENNGVTIQELGLFQTGGDLFARAVIAPIVKTVAITVGVTWTITITV